MFYPCWLIYLLDLVPDETKINTACKIVVNKLLELLHSHQFYRDTVTTASSDQLQAKSTHRTELVVYPRQ